MKAHIPLDIFKLKDGINHTRVNPPFAKLINEFIDQLKKNGFAGDTLSENGNASAWSADNSIYWLTPQLILQPKNTQSIQIALKIAKQNQFKELCFTMRGGSTSTNAQSLNYSVIIDTVKYLNQIISHNLNNNDNEKYIEVEAGIGPFEINQFLKPFGYFFPIQISTNNRACIGGMIATNAAGRGSLVYGNMNNQIKSVSGFLSNANSFEFKNIPLTDAQKIIHHKAKNWRIYQNLIVNQNYIVDVCKKNYPKLKRSYLAYNLPKIFDNDCIDLSQIMAGSEGTLGVITKAKLKIYPINRFKRLIVVKYQKFNDALIHASQLAKYNPHSIETMDDAITGASEKLALFKDLKTILTLNDKACITNFIGLETDDENKLIEQTEEFKNSLIQSNHSYEIIDDEKVKQKLYELREQSAAFFSAPFKYKNEIKTPAPFIEDCIVPLENLSLFVSDLKEILDSYNLHYGIFGHVDVGVLHIRPALNLRNTKDKSLIRQISEKLVAILKKHGGLLWGEHGKGVRAEFTKALLGEEVVKLNNQIKILFDSDEKLNPHKLAGENKDHYLVDSLPLKSNLLNMQSPNNGIWDSVLGCNGNGVCNSLDKSTPMCPTFKASRDLRFSPKGRANMLRGYLLSKEIYNSRRNKKYALSYKNDLKHSLDFCLSCKACETGCPLSVDIAKMKENFYQEYYQKKSRPISDYLIKQLEQKSSFIVKNPNLYNFIVSQDWIKKWFKKIGLIDLPQVPMSKQLKADFFNMMVKLQSTEAVIKGAKNSDKPKIALIFDQISSPFDWQNLMMSQRVLEACGFSVYIPNDIASNKTLKVRGFLSQFEKNAKVSAKKLNELNKNQFRVCMLDSAIVQCFNSEYQDWLNFEIEPISQVIEEKIATLKTQTKNKKEGGTYQIMLHCIEQTHLHKVGKSWQNIFNFLEIKTNLIQSGCCGMAGLFGHQTKTAEFSKQIYQTNWQNFIKTTQDEILTTGFSCKSQVNRMENKTIKHPISILASLLN